MNSVTLHVLLKSSCPLTSIPHPQVSSTHIHPLHLLLQSLCCRSVDSWIPEEHFSSGFVIALVHGVSTVGVHPSLKLCAERWRWCKRGGKLEQPTHRRYELDLALEPTVQILQEQNLEVSMDMFLTNLWHVEEDFSGSVIVRLQIQLQLCLSFASLRERLCFFFVSCLITLGEDLILHFDSALI